jgi:hypothetical protein
MSPSVRKYDANQRKTQIYLLLNSIDDESEEQRIVIGETMLIALKVLLAPLLVATCALIVHRWGSVAGGWLLGLPLVSGPVSVMLVLEHGPRFARDAATGTLLGLVAAATFCVSYAVVASVRSWWHALLVASASCLGVAGLLAWAHPDFSLSVAILLIALAAYAWRLGTPVQADAPPEPSTSSLALRMVISGVAVFVVTSSASALGASVAGVLAPLPVVLAITTASLHRGGDRDVASNLLRGTLAGTWGGVAFFAVIGLLMAPGYVVETYVLALAAALAAAAVASRAPVAAREARRVVALIRVPSAA